MLCATCWCGLLPARTPPRAAPLMGTARQGVHTTKVQTRVAQRCAGQCAAQRILLERSKARRSVKGADRPKEGLGPWARKEASSGNVSNDAGGRDMALGPKRGPRPEARARRVGRPLRPALERRVPWGALSCERYAGQCSEALCRKMHLSGARGKQR
jgi:hypothetical protein